MATRITRPLNHAAIKTKQLLSRFFSGETLNLKVAVFLILLEVTLGILGYVFFERYTWVEAFYMTIITISTVGYGEIHPLSSQGQFFTSVLILVNLVIFAYTASAFTYYIVQGAFFIKLKRRDMDKKIKVLRNHVILAGFGRFGDEVAEQLRLMEVPFVIIEKDEHIIRAMDISKNLLYIHGDATEDEVLIEAGIKHASAIITAVHDDTSNMYTVLSARQLQPQINIISRAQTAKAARKLKLAGASHVVLPKQIGGFYMAALVTKPDAVEFFSYLTNKSNADISFEEYHYDELPDSFKNKTLQSIRFRKRTGVNVIAYRNPEGRFVVNPPPDLIIAPNTSIIVIGSRDQIDKMLQFCPKIKKNQ